MQIEERKLPNDVLALDVKGKMTLSEVDTMLIDRVDGAVSRGEKRIVLNLEAVPYIDSAGLGEIVRTFTKISKRGGKIKLLHPNKSFQDLLIITQLITILECYDSEEVAVRSFS
jgi:anti-anti-sigma factor